MLMLHQLYGKEALKPDVALSDGAQLLINTLDESEEPLWVLCWGGTNVLAQALQHTNSRSDHAKLRSKLRVYAISDQDDTGAWIRLQFPDVLYINSVHGWNQYGLAAWTGISGDVSSLCLIYLREVIANYWLYRITMASTKEGLISLN
jgi:hypothetical protein